MVTKIKKGDKVRLMKSNRPRTLSLIHEDEYKKEHEVLYVRYGRAVIEMLNNYGRERHYRLPFEKLQKQNTKLMQLKEKLMGEKKNGI